VRVEEREKVDRDWIGRQVIAEKRTTPSSKKLGGGIPKELSGKYLKLSLRQG
jgi:hypothetical protein